MIEWIDAGLLPFREAWDYQNALRAARIAGEIPDTLLLCEHPPVFTLGRRDCHEDWKASFDAIAQAGIDVVQTNRGGRITYHGPGQLVGYCILHLEERTLGIKTLVRHIESVLIETVAAFGITAARDCINPGIWVGADKLGAIGLHVSRQVTQHGFALNHRVRMTDYQYIVPCGLAGRGVTSMDRLLGDATPSRAALCEALQQAMGRVFQDSIVASSASAARKVGPPPVAA